MEILGSVLKFDQELNLLEEYYFGDSEEYIGFRLYNLYKYKDEFILSGVILTTSKVATQVIGIGSDTLVHKPYRDCASNTFLLSRLMSLFYTYKKKVQIFLL